MKFTIGAIMVAAASASGDFNEVRNKFMNWAAEFNRNFATTEEFYQRMANWLETDEFILKINSPFSGETHTAGHNQFSDWTEEEYLSIQTAMDDDTDDMPIWQPEENSPLLMSGGSKDWSTSSCMNKIQNQGGCGSCWAFASTATMESAYCISGKSLLKLSEQQIVDCAKSSGSGCDGGSAGTAYKYLQTHGQELGKDYPYTGKNGSCKYSSSKGKVGTKSSPSTKVDTSSSSGKANMQKAVNIEPAYMSVDASSKTWSTYKSGVISSTACGTKTNHAVTLVGYNSGASTPYWKIRNSWGTSWGESGYGKIQMTSNSPGICGCMSNVQYPHVTTWSGK